MCDKYQRILTANPALAEPGFRARVDAWNILYDITEEMDLNREDAAAFIAYFLTNGREGRLPP